MPGYVDAALKLFMYPVPSKPQKSPYLQMYLVNAVCSILNFFMESAAEAELGGLFFNAQETIIICSSIENLGHP